MNSANVFTDELEQERSHLAARISALHDEKRPLDQELNHLESALRAVKKSRTLRLGLFGVRDSAKSSLLAAWYLFNADRGRGILLRFKDDQSIGYLKAVAQPILKTGSSKATPSAHPTPIQFDFVSRGEEWHVET